MYACMYISTYLCHTSTIYKIIYCFNVYFLYMYSMYVHMHIKFKKVTLSVDFPHHSLIIKMQGSKLPGQEDSDNFL